MMELLRIEAPLTPETARALRAGQRVLLSGVVYTARDAAHRRLCELLDEGGEPPVPLAGAVIYYCGPAPAPPGRPIGSAGPTSSYRMDPYVPRLLEAGMLGMIGKGPRSEAVRAALMARGGVYFAATGGASRAPSSSPTRSWGRRPCGGSWCGNCPSSSRSIPRAGTSMSKARRPIWRLWAKNNVTFCRAAPS